MHVLSVTQTSNPANLSRTISSTVVAETVTITLMYNSYNTQVSLEHFERGGRIMARGSSPWWSRGVQV